MAPIRLAPKHLTFPVGFVVWGLMMVMFSAFVVASRARIEIDGKIVAREEGRYASGPHRLYTKYTIQATATGKRFEYVAESNDNSLNGDLPEGVHLIKRKWNLVYHLNGRPMHDFPVIFYSILTSAGSALALWGTVLLRKRLKSNRIQTEAPPTIPSLF
jgi:hypothetical protein